VADAPILRNDAIAVVVAAWWYQINRAIFFQFLASIASTAMRAIATDIARSVV